MLEEQDNPNSNGLLEFSPLDRAYIEDLETGEGMESETGEFSVQRRMTNQYLVYATRKGKQFTFDNLEDLFSFLEENS